MDRQSNPDLMHNGESSESKVHPSDGIIKAYIQGTLSNHLPDPALLRKIIDQQLSDFEWTNYLVGAHIRTCPICRKKLDIFRKPLVEIHPSESRSPSSNFRTRMKRIALPFGTFFSGVVITIAIVLALTPIAEDGRISKELNLIMYEKNRSGESITGHWSTIRLIRAFQEAVIDLKDIDLDLVQFVSDNNVDLLQFKINDLYEYDVQTGDTLKTISLRVYGDAELWPAIVVFNFGYAEFREFIAENPHIEDVALSSQIDSIVLASKDQKPRD